LFLFAVLLRTFKIARFPDGMDLRTMLGLGLLCGIGFTMSLFVGSLAYARLPLDYTESLLGVLGGSLVSALLGLVWLHCIWCCRSRNAAEGMQGHLVRQGCLAKDAGLKARRRMGA